MVPQFCPQQSLFRTQTSTFSGYWVSSSSSSCNKVFLCVLCNCYYAFCDFFHFGGLPAGQNVLGYNVCDHLVIRSRRFILATCSSQHCLLAITQLIMSFISSSSLLVCFCILSSKSIALSTFIFVVLIINFVFYVSALNLTHVL